jgi:hypothetical protein
MVRGWTLIVVRPLPQDIISKGLGSPFLIALVNFVFLITFQRWEALMAEGQRAHFPAKSLRSASMNLFPRSRDECTWSAPAGVSAIGRDSHDTSFAIFIFDSPL